MRKLLAITALFTMSLFNASIVQAQAPAWGQCGGLFWTGPTTCVSGYTCYRWNQAYHQCIPA